MRKQNNSIIRILILVFAVLIVLTAIGEVTYFLIAKNKLKAIALNPEFSETSLEVGTQYTFDIKTTPSEASIKKAKCYVDDPTSSFEIGENGKAILTTGMNEGNVTVYVECKDIKSQVLTFSIVDSVARAQAEAAAQAEAQQAAEEEAAAEEAAAEPAEVKLYVKSTGDDVNIRSQNSKEGEVLGKAKKGDVFEKVEDVDDWTHIKYKDQDAYMKTEFLTEISEEEYQEGGSSEENKEEEKKEEEKKEEEKKEEKTEGNAGDNTEAAGQTKEEAEAKLKADQEKAAQEAAQQPAEAPAAETPAAEAPAPAPAAPAVGGHEYGGHVFTDSEWNYLLQLWDYTGDAAEMITHHSAAELKAVLDDKNPGGVIRSPW
ncbi:MAG: SH3 domain-containing protein [Lachnospiraceae bacterium]|nr:SH3 domain-containing protein [Lachnospiraceae bacterium]